MGEAVISFVFMLHRAVTALEARVAEGDDITWTNLVVLHRRGVGEVGVDEAAVRAGADGLKGGALGFDEL